MPLPARWSGRGAVSWVEGSRARSAEFAQQAAETEPPDPARATVRAITRPRSSLGVAPASAS
jgi:hypothetical protein